MKEEEAIGMEKVAYDEGKREQNDTHVDIDAGGAVNAASGVTTRPEVLHPPNRSVANRSHTGAT